MRIILKISSFVLKDKIWDEMVETLFQQLAKKCPQHHFFLMSNSKQNITNSPNIKNIVVSNPLNNGLSLKLWHDYKLPSILKKSKIDVLINADGICSLRTSIPQITLIKDFALQSVSKAKKRGFIKKRFQKSLVKAEAIVVFNTSDKLEFLKIFPLSNEKIIHANLFAGSIYQPKGWQEKEKLKDKYSEGKEYFLYKMGESPSIDPLILLKAFSHFKKRQQSNMQLVIIGNESKAANILAEKITTYKYRNEVKLIDISTAAEQVDVLASAYALVHFSTMEIDLTILNTMQTGVPIIVLKNSLSNEKTDNTLLYADANNAASIAEQMKTIYKDENLRSRLVAVGMEIATSNTVEKAATQIWSAISKTVEERLG